MAHGARREKGDIEMTSSQVKALVLWLLTAAGTALTAKGIVDADQWQQIVTSLTAIAGAAVTLAPILYSLWAKRRR